MYMYSCIRFSTYYAFQVKSTVVPTFPQKRPRRPLSSKLSGFVIKRVPDEEASLVPNGVSHIDGGETASSTAATIRNHSSI